MDTWNRTKEKKIISEKRYYRTTKFQSLLYNTQEHTGIMQTFCLKFFIGFVLSLLKQNKTTKQTNNKPCGLLFPSQSVVSKGTEFSQHLICCHLATSVSKIKPVKCTSASSRREQGTVQSCAVTSKQSCWKSKVRGRHVCCPARASHVPSPTSRCGRSPLSTNRCCEVPQGKSRDEGSCCRTSKDAASTMPVHLLDPKSQPGTHTIGKVCLASASSFLKPCYEHSHFWRWETEVQKIRVYI